MHQIGSTCYHEVLQRAQLRVETHESRHGCFLKETKVSQRGDDKESPSFLVSASMNVSPIYHCSAGVPKQLNRDCSITFDRVWIGFEEALIVCGIGFTEAWEVCAQVLLRILDG
jgi:hypothetical protein